MKAEPHSYLEGGRSWECSALRFSSPNLQERGGLNARRTHARTHAWETTTSAWPKQISPTFDDRLGISNLRYDLSGNGIPRMATKWTLGDVISCKWTLGASAPAVMMKDHEASGSWGHAMLLQAHETRGSQLAVWNMGSVKRPATAAPANRTGEDVCIVATLTTPIS